MLASGGSIGSPAVRAEDLGNPVVVTGPNGDGRPSRRDVPAPATEVLTLEHPQVVDTATIQAGDTTVNLYGIDGVGGELADGLQAFLSADDTPLRCQGQAGTGYVCLMADGTDVAQVALANGAATTTSAAPDAYRDQEAAAQAARLGIWGDLPPPPETIQHPIVYDTATLSARGRTFALSGIIGFTSPYAGQLQGIIASRGDSVTCAAQPEAGQYVCLLPDGTDVAKVALANGLARLGDDAPVEYGAPQRAAVRDHRGYWRTAPDDALAAAATPPAFQDRPPIADEDDGHDGIRYAGGVPVATAGTETVFLMLGAGALGWGYYDHSHRWHAAPADVTAHMEQFHPAGAGLHVYDNVAAIEDTLRQDPSPLSRSSTAQPVRRPEPVTHPPAMAHPSGSVTPRTAAVERPAAEASTGAFHPRRPETPAARAAAVPPRAEMHGGEHR